MPARQRKSTYLVAVATVLIWAVAAGAASPTHPGRCVYEPEEPAPYVQHGINGVDRVYQGITVPKPTTGTWIAKWQGEFARWPDDSIAVYMPYGYCLINSSRPGCDRYIRPSITDEFNYIVDHCDDWPNSLIRIR